MVARYNGRCARCGREIKAGRDTIRRSDDGGGWEHTTCPDDDGVAAKANADAVGPGADYGHMTDAMAEMGRRQRALSPTAGRYGYGTQIWDDDER